MIRLRYLLAAVLLLGLVPRLLDSAPALSCAILAVDCIKESGAKESAGKPAAAPEAVHPHLARAPRTEHVPSSRTGSYDVAARLPIDQVVPSITDRHAAASATGNEVSFTATLEFGGMVTMRWHVAKEAGFDYYLLDRKLQSDPDDAFERYIAFQLVDGSGGYSWTDTPARDAYTYRLRALASTDQSDAGTTLGRADVAVDYLVGLTLGDFASDAASGVVSINWTTAHEGGVVTYVLDRRLEGAPNYDLNVEVGYPRGEGTVYSLVDKPRGTGTFVYRLRATLTNGTDRILAEGGVTL